MTRLIYDQFSKDLLEELLSPYGQVHPAQNVASEVLEIDVYFTPNPQSEDRDRPLGLLGRLALGSPSPSLFEPFRNAATEDEILSCITKLSLARKSLQREANRQKVKLQKQALPKLWILTPTASKALLKGFRAEEDEKVSGLHWLADSFRTAIIAIHKLPTTPETLWLRLLGRGKVQKQALDDLEALAPDNPLRSNTLSLFYTLKKHLEARGNLDTSDRRLVMRLAPLYQQEREQILREAEQRGLQQGLQQGIEQGIERGLQQGERLIVENLLRVRFGELDEGLAAIIEPIIALPPQEFTPLLLQLSLEELLARFGREN